MYNTIERIVARWTNPDEIRLRAGEIDPETMRTVLAITNAMGREIKSELDKPE